MLKKWIQKRKIEKEINKYFQEIVKRYKRDFYIELAAYKKRKSEKDRIKRLQDKFIFEHVYISITVLALLAAVCAILSFVSKWFLLGYLFISIFMIITIISYQKLINKEKERNLEIKNIRIECWERAIKATVKNYSRERYLHYLISFHRNRPMQRIFVAIVSISFTVLIVYSSRKLEIKDNDVVTLTVASIVNIVTNFFGNMVVAELSEDYYYELLMNDMWLY
jgi:hypothetical protein